METPHLDNLINDLKAYDRNDMLSDDGRNQLNEYEAIKQALSLGVVVQQRELLVSYEKWKEDGDIKNLTAEQMADWFIEVNQ
jgi:hypothetical protein